MDLTKLKDEFPPDDLEWRIQSGGLKDRRPWALIVPYVRNRAIMDRLDEVCGMENWNNEFKAGPGGGVMCGISIRIDDEDATSRGEWVTKWDGAENSDIEPVKGGLSNAMKRAAVQWGIGRYLYHLGTAGANFCTDGENSAKIDGEYFKWSPPSTPPAKVQGKAGESPSRKEEKRTPPPPPDAAKGQGTPPREQPQGNKPDTGEAATEPQKKAIHAIAKDKGIENPRLFGIISEQVGRPIESTSALTKREASRIIELLNGMDKAFPPAGSDVGDGYDEYK